MYTPKNGLKTAIGQRMPTFWLNCDTLATRWLKRQGVTGPLPIKRCVTTAGSQNRTVSFIERHAGRNISTAIER